MLRNQDFQLEFDSMTHHPSPVQAGKTALVVIGMHRSGTSATTGALQCLGVQLGSRLYAGHKGINDKGYFEHAGIADTNEEALLALGSSWDDILLKEDGWWQKDALKPYAARIRDFIRKDFSRSPLWAIKDPRVCRLLPWWLEILAAEQVRPYFLFVVRSPSAVHRSLQKRDGFSLEKAMLLWTLHYLEAERWSRGFPQTYLEFDRFLESPKNEFERVERELGLAFPVSPAQASPCLEKFISRDLRHHQGEQEKESDTVFSGLARQSHDALLDAVTRGSAALESHVMDDLWRQMVNLQQGFPAPLAEHLRGVSQSRGELQLLVNRLVRSWSWYTGKPVRFVERLLGRHV
jgi:hypothetical protein